MEAELGPVTTGSGYGCDSSAQLAENWNIQVIDEVDVNRRKAKVSMQQRNLDTQYLAMKPSVDGVEAVCYSVHAKMM